LCDFNFDQIVVTRKEKQLHFCTLTFDFGAKEVFSGQESFLGAFHQHRMKDLARSAKTPACGGGKVAK